MGISYGNTLVKCINNDLEFLNFQIMFLKKILKNINKNSKKLLEILNKQKNKNFEIFFSKKKICFVYYFIKKIFKEI
nr:hypothetical protein CcurKRNrm2_p100 [Cryptomonas curvata]